MKMLSLSAAVGVLLMGAVSAQADSHKAKHEGGHHARMGHHGQHMFDMFDTNGDGAVSSAEVAAEYGRMIAFADTDGDGALSADEFRRRGRMFMRLRMFTLFDLLDGDGDQKITAEELTAPSARMFKRYDGDNSDSLTQEEMPQRKLRKHREKK